jgi:predicted transposase/invertase (TIGR01784 family)
MQRKLVSFDWAIKRILRSKVNFEILEGFLSELLKEDITILEILESESNKDSYDDKSNQVDIKVRNSTDEIVIIEIQYSREMDYLQRMLYATSKVITEHISQGYAYSKIKKVISINILYFDFGDGDDYIYKGTTSFEGMHTHKKLYLNEMQKSLYNTQHIEKIYPEYYLIKVKNFDDNAKDSLDEWIDFLKNETISENPKAKGLLKAKETLDFLKMSDEEKIDYTKREESLRKNASIYEGTYIAGGIAGKKEGVIEGKIEGKKEEKFNIARSSLKAGLDISVVATITGLSVEEIKSL